MDVGGRLNRRLGFWGGGIVSGFLAGDLEFSGGRCLEKRNGAAIFFLLGRRRMA